jgi:hypothetical protein
MDGLVAGAQSERRSGFGPVRSLLGGKASPAALSNFVAHVGRFCNLSYTNDSILLLFNPQQLGGFGPKAGEFFILGLVLFHPLNALVVALAGLVFIAPVPLSHGQEEPGRAVVALAKVLIYQCGKRARIVPEKAGNVSSPAQAYRRLTALGAEHHGAGAVLDQVVNETSVGPADDSNWEAW